MHNKPDIRTPPLINQFPTLDEADVLIIKAVGAGVAKKQQQIDFMKIVMEKISCYAAMTYSSEVQEMAFGEGRRFVGQVLQEVLTTPSMEKPDARRDRPKRKPTPRFPAYGPPGSDTT